MIVEDTNPVEIPANRLRLPLFALFGGNAISMIGNSITGIAIPWFVLETTGSASKTGLIGFAGMLPFVLGGFFGGTIVDRFGHKRTSVIGDLASGLTVAAIPLLYHTIGLAFWQLMVLTFLGALLDMPGRTARIALSPNLAKRAHVSLDRVNAADQALSGFSMLVGPALAGILIVILGTSNVLWIDAASFAISALVIATVVPMTPLPGIERTTSYLDEMKEGLHYIRESRLLRAILAQATVINFLASPLFAVVVPVYAARTYGNAVEFGTMIAGFGGGSIAGSVLYGALAARLPKRTTFISAFIAGGSSISILAFQPPLSISIGVFAFCGLALAPLNPMVGTVILTRTPEYLLGRVIGTVGSVATAFAPIGIITAGFTLVWIGLSGTFIGISAGFTLVGLLMVREPALRELDKT